MENDSYDEKLLNEMFDDYNRSCDVERIPQDIRLTKEEFKEVVNESEVGLLAQVLFAMNGPAIPKS